MDPQQRTEEGDALAVFSPEEQERLERLRREVARGQRSDSYPIDRRQDFVRWLVAEGRLSEELPLPPRRRRPRAVVSPPRGRKRSEPQDEQQEGSSGHAKAVGIQ
jgi:hypothetical protein